MKYKIESLNKPKVVLIADLMEVNCDEKIEQRRDLEKSEYSTVEQLRSTIAKIGFKTIHYQTPEELAEKADNHKNDLILSIFGGEVSRNRMALVPAVCETFNLKYVGPDVYGRIIAQDKEVSKRLALDIGLGTPKWLIVRRSLDIKSLGRLKYPVVVKPVMEGSSIGITQSSLCQTSETAMELTAELLNDLGQPILVEEFVSGKEAALSVIETMNGYEWAYSEILIPDDPDHFSNRLFDSVEKATPTKGRTVRNIDNELSSVQLEKIFAFLKAFGHFGYCRVDGKHFNGEFHFLEITPDAWIDTEGQFAKAFTEKGWSYDEVLRAVLFSAHSTLQDQSTND